MTVQALDAIIRQQIEQGITPVVVPPMETPSAQELLDQLGTIPPAKPVE